MWEIICVAICVVIMYVAWKVSRNGDWDKN